MRHEERQAVSLRAVAVAAAVCLCMSFEAAAVIEAEFAEYDKLVAAGELEAADSAAEAILAALEEENPSSAALKSIRDRIRATRDAGRRLENKLNLIAGGVDGRASAFRFVAPTPVELCEQITRNISARKPHFQRLADDEEAFAKSALRVSLAVVDRAAVGAYRDLRDSLPASRETAKARSYLTAYIAGAHDKDTFADAIALVTESLTDGALPVFLLEDAVVEIGDFAAAARTVEALDAPGLPAWPEGERLRLLREMAGRARESGQYEWAVTANRKIVEAGDPEAAEKAQFNIVELHAEHADTLRKDRRRRDQAALKTAYREAAAACAEYLQLFPDGPQALAAGYRKAYYEYSGENHEQAVVDAAAFREAYPESAYVPSVMLIEGLAANGLGKTDEAIAIFLEVVEKYPKSKPAGKAQFMAGYAYLATQRYSEAKDCFQRVVDYYPNDSSLDKANRFLKQLSDMEKRRAPGTDAVK